jgi:hypothetical protein
MTFADGPKAFSFRFSRTHPPAGFAPAAGGSVPSAAARRASVSGGTAAAAAPAAIRRKRCLREIGVIVFAAARYGRLISQMARL